MGRFSLSRVPAWAGVFAAASRRPKRPPNSESSSIIPPWLANNPLFVLAHLGLARAYALQGQRDKSRAAYQEFFNLWKDADPDIPIYQQAKAEYAKLQ